MIEQFIIYQYCGIFYTKEDLENLGFIYMRDRNDFKRLKDKNPNYVIIKKRKTCEAIYSIQDYLKCDNEKLEGKFLYNFGKYGLILGADKYYGITYKNKQEEKIQLFSQYSECFDMYSKLQNELVKVSECFSTDNIYNKFGNEYVKQKKEIEIRHKVLNLAINI